MHVRFPDFIRDFDWRVCRRYFHAIPLGNIILLVMLLNDKSTAARATRLDLNPHMQGNLRHV